jgi:hypothetical protein
MFERKKYWRIFLGPAVHLLPLHRRHIIRKPLDAIGKGGLPKDYMYHTAMGTLHCGTLEPDLTAIVCSQNVGGMISTPQAPDGGFGVMVIQILY